MGAFSKHRYIINFALSSLTRRLGKNLALIVAYTFVLFLLSSLLFCVDSLKTEASLILQDAPEMTVQRLVAGRQSLVPVDYIEAIARIRGVQSVEQRLWGYYYDAASGANYTLLVNAALNDHAGEIFIGSGVARQNTRGRQGQGLGINDILHFKTSDGTVLSFSVQGLLPSASKLVSADLVQVSEQDFRKIFAVAEGYATDLVLRVKNSKELATIATKITQTYPDTRPILREESLRTYDAIFDWRGGVIIMVLSSVLFAFIILAWDKATGLSAEEKREIGILKAIGWETSDILVMKFWEGTTVSLIAFFLGMLLAYLHIFLASSLLFEPVLKGWSVLYPNFKLTPYINVSQIATLFFLTVIPYTVVTIVPTWRSATIDPDSVMRM